MRPGPKLKRPDYCEPGRVFCKGCGDEIAGYIGTGARRHYSVHPNYRELKIATDDPRFGFHVTCLCVNCVQKAGDDLEFQQEILEADLTQMVKSVPSLARVLSRRRAKGVVAATNRPEALP